MGRRSSLGLRAVVAISLTGCGIVSPSDATHTLSGAVTWESNGAPVIDTPVILLAIPQGGSDPCYAFPHFRCVDMWEIGQSQTNNAGLYVVSGEAESCDWLVFVNVAGLVDSWAVRDCGLHLDVDIEVPN